MVHFKLKKTTTLKLIIFQWGDGTFSYNHDNDLGEIHISFSVLSVYKKTIFIQYVIPIRDTGLG